MTAPAPRTETITWTAEVGPRYCEGCEHNHWGWVARDHWLAAGFAPQWRYCDNEECTCRGLRARQQ